MGTKAHYRVFEELEDLGDAARPAHLPVCVGGRATEARRGALPRHGVASEAAIYAEARQTGLVEAWPYSGSVGEKARRLYREIREQAREQKRAGAQLPEGVPFAWGGGDLFD